MWNRCLFALFVEFISFSIARTHYPRRMESKSRVEKYEFIRESVFKALMSWSPGVAELRLINECSDLLPKAFV